MKSYYIALAELFKQAAMQHDLTLTSIAARLLELSTEPEKALAYWRKDKEYASKAVDTLTMQEIEDYLQGGSEMKALEELQKMNDQQLTFELACLVFGENECYKTRCLQVAECTSGAAKYVDINDWSWIMPLVVEHKLDIAPANSGLWYCAHWFDDDKAHESLSDTLQRAIAQCLVLKLQGEAK